MNNPSATMVHPESIAVVRSKAVDQPLVQASPIVVNNPYPPLNPQQSFHTSSPQTNPTHLRGNAPHPSTFTRWASDALVWKAKANVFEMQQCCGDTFYVLQSDKTSGTIEEQIRKDVPRTFPAVGPFATINDQWSIGHFNLHKVLRAYAAMDPDVGYVQGMNFVAGVPLFFMPADEAFWVFSYMMQSPEMGLRDYFLPDFPRLQVSLRILNHLIATRLPLLSSHLHQHKVQITSFVTQWFLTAFSYNLDISAVPRLWNSLFVHGHDFLFSFALAVFEFHQTAMLSKEGHELLEYVVTFSRELLPPPNAMRTAVSQLGAVRHTLATFSDNNNNSNNNNKERSSPKPALSSTVASFFRRQK